MMQSSSNIPLVLLAGLLLANLPFFTQRVLGVWRTPRKHAWLLWEVLLCFAAWLLFARLLEGRLNTVAPQGWQFYVVLACLFCTMAFPGFVWRFLRRPSA